MHFLGVDVEMGGGSESEKKKKQFPLSISI